MADMMAKALEEQAAMQAEMDRQMASLDVRPSPLPWRSDSAALRCRCNLRRGWCGALQATPLAAADIPEQRDLHGSAAAACHLASFMCAWLLSFACADDWFRYHQGAGQQQLGRRAL